LIINPIDREILRLIEKKLRKSKAKVRKYEKNSKS